ncbi:hypothetical protein [Candidatus Ruminimicrobiellum ovillum]|uniref:hypothetical protein n=1 Tax=Candidatus Ruminimicrobiellum ovillum TaxID=1947927 RepID=UPI00355A43F5
MNFTAILVLNILVAFLGFLIIYLSAPKKFELKIINNELTALLYSTYFFLPFTTKIRKYKNIKEAYVRRRLTMDKRSVYYVYDLMLKSSKRSITILKGWDEDKKLKEYCDKINKSISFFEEYSLDICGADWRKFTIFLMVIFPLIIILAESNSKNFNYSQNIAFQYFLYIYLSTMAIITISIMLSLTINRSIEYKKQTNVISSVNYIKEKNVEEKNRDINSEAQRMYDSIIK